MFVAIRELRFARGRFALMGLVVALIAVLTVLLTGLADGLVADGVSGLRSMPVDGFAFQGDVKGDLFSRSTVDRSAWEAWARRRGVDAVPYGNTLAHARVEGSGTDVDLALFGAPPGSFVVPEPAEGRPVGTRPDGILVSRKLIDEGVRIGDRLDIGKVPTQATVIGTIGEASFGHVGVAWAPLDLWQQVHYGLPGDLPEAARRQATAVALRFDGGGPSAAVEAATGTRLVSKTEAYGASPGFTAETATMDLIRVFLYAIATLVVGAFFVVWTVQRRGEIALLKALGASTGYIVRDGIGQVLVVLVAATALGVACGVAAGALVSGGIPFALHAGSVALAAIALVVLGVIGSLVAVRRITSVDPVVALGANR